MSKTLAKATKMDPEFEKNYIKFQKKEFFRIKAKKQNNGPKSYFVNTEHGLLERCKRSNKICYSKKDAAFVINHPLRHRKKVPVRYYKCEFCGAYHTTSQKT